MSSLMTPFVAEQMRRRMYQVTEGPATAVTGGAADSRKVRAGDLFTAFRGEMADGNAYVSDALRRGAVAAICERAPEGSLPDKTIVVAPDALKAVGELANDWRRHCNPRVVGITGTVGKTTAKELTAAALECSFRTHRSEGNFNSREGLPLALMSLTTEDEVSVLEMATDSTGEIPDLCRIAEPEVGVVLNVGLTHVSKIGSIEAIQAEKLSLARYLPEHGTAVLNGDDPRVGPAAAELHCRVLTFGERDGSDLRRGPITDLGLAGVEFELTYASERRTVRSPLPGAHVAPAAMAAVGVGIALGMTFEDAVKAVGEAEVDGRMRPLETDTGAIIIDDRYNSSPASLAGALEMLSHLPGQRIALIGKMAELGDYEEGEHRKIGILAAQCCDEIAAFGETGRTVIEAARRAGARNASWYATKEEAAAAVRKGLKRGDHVLVKGSRSEALETVLPVLRGAQ
jgi:UDP-N-acetylmuramoyl-tripeptide--D-alanyl-D-alanine ligase